MAEEQDLSTREDEVILATIADYYKKRDMPVPGHDHALAFLLSEVGELCEAYRKNYGAPVKFEQILVEFENLGMRADEWVSGQSQWQRNGDRKKAPSVMNEAADVLMMLYVFSQQIKIYPFLSLLDKMKRKLAQLENQRN